MKQWWQGLQSRERYTLLFGFIALLGLGFYALLWEPLTLARDDLRQRVQGQREAYAWMREAGEELRGLQAQTPGATQTQSGESLLVVLDRGLRGGPLAGSDKQIEPQGAHQVRLDFPQVAFNPLAAWLAELQTDYGIRVKRAHIEPLNIKGKVKARLVLERE